MTKFLSDRQQSLKVGISSYTESKTVLQTIGKVGIGTTNAGGRSLYVIGDTQITGVITAASFIGNGSQLTDINTSSIIGVMGYADVSGIATYATNAGVSTSVIGGIASVTQLNVSGISTLGITITTNLTSQQLNVSGISTLTQISAGGSTGTNQYVLSSTGTGLSWQSVTSIGATSGFTVVDDTSTNASRFLLFTSATSGIVNTENVSSTKLTYNPSSGSLGIGTTSASQPLDVNGNVRLRGGLYDSGNSSGASNNVLSSNGSGGWSWQPVTSVGAISGVTISDDTSTNALRYLLFTSATSGIVGTENVSSTKLTYNPSSGSLGINTSTPTQPLDVNGNVRLRGGLYDSGNSSGGSNTVLTSNGSGGWSWQSVSAIGGSNIIIDATDTADASRFLVFTKISSGSTATEYVSTTGLVFNPSSGNLGIGSTLPISKLDIIGNVKVSGIVTATTFSGSGSQLTGVVASYATNAGLSTNVKGTASRVLYNSGTDTTTTSANLTFDGTILGIGETAQIKRITSSFENSFIAGTGAGANITSINYPSGYNNILGIGAGANIYSQNGPSGYNNIIGYGAGASIQVAGAGSAGYNNLIGVDVGVNIFTSTGVAGYNNFIGYQVAHVNQITNGYHNAIGYQAGNKLSSGTGNNLLGYQAGLNITSGSYNVAIGYAAANTNVTTGSGNVVIGYNRCVPTSGGSNQLVIGSGSNDWINGNSSYNVGIGTTTPTQKLHVVGSFTATDTRIQSLAEESKLINGNTVNLVYNTGGGNIAICTNPTGPITLNVTGIPVDSSFNNIVLTFTVVAIQTSIGYACNTINLNGLSKTIKYPGSIVSVASTNSYDIFNFTGINTVGSASTTANYQILGIVNGNFK